MRKNMPSEGGHQIGAIKDPASACGQSVEWSLVSGFRLPVLTAVSIWDKDITLNTRQADLKCEGLYLL